MIPHNLKDNTDTITAEQSIAVLVDFDTLDKNIDALMAGETHEAVSPEIIALYKEAVVAVDEGLKQLYESGCDANTIVYGRSKLIDQLICSIYRHLFSELKQDMALIAVGGYGRGELHPKSDIDLMILLRQEEDPLTKDLLEKFLMLLWDIKLEIGHSVRTVEECSKEAEKDITVATNIMEARLLSGDEDLYNEMKKQTGPDMMWDSKAFFQAKLDEQVQRNGKFNDTAYNLEPNLKESRGGLRDIQMIGWVAKRHFNANSLRDLVKEDFLLEEELETLLDGQHLLWRIRCSLHYLAGRREDRLLFDYQRELAHQFGFQNDEDGANNEAIEQFMQQYYRTVIELERLNEMLLQHFREEIIYADIATEVDLINKSFRIRNGYLETASSDVFRDNPCAILELFLILQEHPEIQGVRAATIREVRKYKSLIDDSVRQSARAHQLFIQLMSSSRGVTHELRRMHRYGILAAYIPAFDSIVGRMQYDLFHAYTVDQHTLFVIRNMRRLSVPDYCHEFPLASGIFQHLPKPGLLYIAGLFHDIAKGRPGDHSELGAVDAKEFCITHGLTEEESELVSWLVRSHLLMSMTAQRKDLSDPDVISTFAKQVATIERLDHLYLLTISDIRATNPKQWNDWKNKLMAELYSKTASLLNRGKQQGNKESNIQEIQTSSLRRLVQQGIDSHQANELWQTFSEDYFQGHTYGQIAWHTSLILEALQNGTLDIPLVKTRIHTSSNSIQLIIYMKARQHIFYDVVSALGHCDVDIVNSLIESATNGYSLESFRLAPMDTQDRRLDIIAQEIENSITRRLNETSDVTSATMSSSSKHKFFSSPTIVGFTDTGKDTNIVTIETIDRTGVLENIAKTFIECNIKIINARIATAGEKVLDYFTVCNADGHSLTSEQKKKLKEQLKDAL